MRRSPLYWPGLCVAGLCIGTGARQLTANSPLLGIAGLVIGFTLAVLTMKGAHQ